MSMTMRPGDVLVLVGKRAELVAHAFKRVQGKPEPDGLHDVLPDIVGHARRCAR